jgi:hypothetical protein
MLSGALSIALPITVPTTLISLIPALLTTPFLPLALLPLPAIIPISLTIDSAAALIVNIAVTAIRPVPATS